MICIEINYSTFHPAPAPPEQPEVEMSSHVRRLSYLFPDLFLPSCLSWREYARQLEDLEGSQLHRRGQLGLLSSLEDQGQTLVHYPFCGGRGIGIQEEHPRLSLVLSATLLPPRKVLHTLIALKLTRPELCSTTLSSLLRVIH